MAESEKQNESNAVVRWLTAPLRALGRNIVGRSVLKVWRGQERLWKVFWLWFVLFYPMSIVLWGGGMVLLKQESIVMLAPIVGGFVVILGFVMAFCYPFFILSGMWNGGRNTKSQSAFLHYLARFFIMPFCLLHYMYVGLIGIPTLLFLVS